MKNCEKCGTPLVNGNVCSNCGFVNSEEAVIKVTEPKVCQKCNYELKDEFKYCPICGKKVVDDLVDEEITEEDIRENKNISILCYLGIFLLIPFVIRKDSKFVKYHANQGLILTIFSMISSIIMIIPVLGWIVGIVGFIMSLVFFVLGIINVVKGRVKPLPLIGKYNIIK